MICVEIGNRLVVFLQVPKGEGATIENRVIILLFFQSDVVIFDCLFVVLLLQVGEGPETVGGDAVRIQLDRLVEILERLVVFLLGSVNDATVDVAGRSYSARLGSRR